MDPREESRLSKEANAKLTPLCVKFRSADRLQIVLIPGIVSLLSAPVSQVSAALRCNQSRGCLW